MKTAVLYIASMLSVCAPAFAANLDVNGSGILQGASGVTVLGSDYSVTFVEGTCVSEFSGCDSAADFTFTTLASATSAAQALLDQVFINGPDGAFDDTPTLIAGCGGNAGDPCFAYIPYAPQGGNVAITAAINNALGGAADDNASGTVPIGFSTVNHITVWAVWTLDPPTLACSGFFSPMDNGSVRVKKNRVLPFKAQLINSGGQLVDDLGITAQPIIQVIFDDGVGSGETDVTGDALPAGAGTDGNQFEFLDGNWRFNLKTKNYSATGTYVVTMVSGDGSEYQIDPTCTGQFVIN